jgi:hypothetical protein
MHHCILIKLGVVMQMVPPPASRMDAKYFEGGVKYVLAWCFRSTDENLS